MHIQRHHCMLAGQPQHGLGHMHLRQEAMHRLSPTPTVSDILAYVDPAFSANRASWRKTSASLCCSSSSCCCRWHAMSMWLVYVKIVAFFCYTLAADSRSRAVRLLLAANQANGSLLLPARISECKLMRYCIMRFAIPSSVGLLMAAVLWNGGGQRAASPVDQAKLAQGGRKT